MGILVRRRAEVKGGAGRWMKGKFRYQIVG